MNADTTMNASSAVSMELGEDWRDIRDQVRRICEGFPGSYWQDLDEKSLYPDAFVEALTKSGYLGALIPEEYGGSGLPVRAASVILETIHASGCSAAASSSNEGYKSNAMTG